MVLFAKSIFIHQFSLKMGKNGDSDVPIGEMAQVNADLPTLKTQRSTMKRNISKLKTKMEKEGSSLDYTIIKCRLQILESYFTQVSYIQTQIERLDPLDEGRSDVEELFVQAKAYLVDLLSEKRRESDMDLSILNNTSSSFSHQNRLPQLKLPKFDGKYSEYSRFINTFNNMVHEEPCISKIDKFGFLLNCLSGPALAMVEPFQVVEENYQKVLDKLKERYDNKNLIFIDNINSIFSISPMNNSNPTELRSILDTVAALRSSLLSLGSELDVMNAIIIHIILSKVDPVSKTVYDEKQDLNRLPSWDDFYNILGRRCQFLESRAAEADSYNCKKFEPKVRRPASSFITSNTSCEYCQSHEHLVANCPSYLSLSVSHRFDFVKGAHLCQNCLRKGHFVSKCQSNSRCRICRVSHHTTLHNHIFESSTQPSISSFSPHQSSNSSSSPHQSSNLSFQRSSSSNSPPKQQSSFQPTSNQQPKPSKSSTSSASIYLTTRSSFVTQRHRQCLLPTAIVFIKDRFGLEQPARALLDSCSEINLITQEIVDRLHLHKTTAVQEIIGAAEIRAKLKYEVTATIKSRISNFEWTSDFLVTKSISPQQPSERFDISNWNIPKGIELADPQFNIPQRIDLLINSEAFFDFLLDGKIILGHGCPRLINSQLGWIVGGKIDWQQLAQTKNQL